MHCRFASITLGYRVTHQDPVWSCKHTLKRSAFRPQLHTLCNSGSVYDIERISYPRQAQTIQIYVMCQRKGVLARLARGLGLHACIVVMVSMIWWHWQLQMWAWLLAAAALPPLQPFLTSMPPWKVCCALELRSPRSHHHQIADMEAQTWSWHTATSGKPDSCTSAQLLQLC